MQFKTTFVIIITLLTSFLSACITQKNNVTDSFDGVWSTGNTDRDFIYVIHQNGSKACGYWHYFATNAFYDGRFVGNVVGNKLSIKEMCGTGGDRYCPKPSSYASSTPANEGGTVWKSSKEAFILCNNTLYDTGSPFYPASCSEVNNNKKLNRYNKNINYSLSLQELGKDKVEQDWLKSCLEDDN